MTHDTMTARATFVAAPASGVAPGGALRFVIAP
jgi:hypothetical protein